MVDFKERNDFEAWLEDKPREWAVVLAARAALRVAPILARGTDFMQINTRLLLPTMRCMLIAVAYGVQRDEDIKSAAYAAYAANANANAAAAAAYAAYAAYAAVAINAAANAAAAYAAKYTWKIVSGDATQLHEGISPQELAVSRLWPKGEESNWSRKNWQDLKDHCAQSPEEGWDVWVTWWQERRDGHPYNAPMERDIALIPNEDWDKGPAHVNAIIADIRAKSVDLPPVHSAAPSFRTQDNRIVLRNDPPDTDPTEDQAALYDALREQAAELQTLCPENSNRYAAQGKAVSRFLAALGADYGSMRITSLWIAGQRMRRFARADAAKHAAADPEDEPMEPDQGVLFEEVVTTYNVFSIGEPLLKQKDEQGRDRATLSPVVTAEARAVRTAVAQTPPLFNEEVVEVLDTVLDDADDPVPGIEARGIVMTRETFENLLNALARKAIQEQKPEPAEGTKEEKPESSEIVKAIKSQFKGGLVKGGVFIATAFIATHQPTLLAFAEKLPLSAVWTAIIKRIAAKWDESP